jgi:hypothetical protein
LNQKHVLAIFHNSLGGGDSIVVNAKETTRGWEIEIQDSSSYDYVMPLDKIEDLSVESLERFVDGITMKDEPSFVGGLVFGFLNANWPPDRKLDSRQRKEAAEFAEVESDDFPELAERYCKRIAEWAAKHP